MNHKKIKNFPKIAIVGVGALFPGSANNHDFWQNILNGVDLITDVPDSHWLVSDHYDSDPNNIDKVYAKRGGFLPYIDFDPIAYGIPPKDISAIDVVQLLSIVIAERVLKDTFSVETGKVDRKNIGVILGQLSITDLSVQMSARIQKPFLERIFQSIGLTPEQMKKVDYTLSTLYPEWKKTTTSGLLSNVTAGRIANRLNLGGINCVVDAACASSFAAIEMAMQELISGHSDLIITGGVDALNNVFMYMCFSKPPVFSRQGDCRSFSNFADGTVLGEGLGMFALRRLDDAERDGDKIYAVIRGVGASSDGREKSIYTPTVTGQATAIQRALLNSNVDPSEIELVEAHGTATPVGDLTEFEGLKKAFENVDRMPIKPWCALGSIKSQIGHTKGAAGAAGLFKVVMALHHKVLPPTIKVDKPNEKLELKESPFYLNTKSRPWIHSKKSPRKASLSGFGFGGTNFHLIVEEYTKDESVPQRIHSSLFELVLLSADSLDNLIKKSEEIKNQFSTQSLANVARNTQCDFQPKYDFRLAIITESIERFDEILEAAVIKIKNNPDDPFFLQNKMHYSRNTQKPKIALLFSGQGSQYVNMTSELLMEFSESREVWDKIIDAPWYGAPQLHQIVFPPPVFTDSEQIEQEKTLQKTEHAQPAIGAVALSQLALLNKLKLKADCFAGHSYGEIIALYSAGVIPDIDTFFRISKKRGELMSNSSQEASGAMTAVKMTEEALTALFYEKRISHVDIANINSPEQMVISGELNSIEKLEEYFLTHNIYFKRLPVSGAFHSKLMQSASNSFYQYLEQCKLKNPVSRVYSNITGKVYPTDTNAIKEIMASQLTNPVRFSDLINSMYQDGVRLFLELGPGSTLTKLVRDCLENKPHFAVAMDQKNTHGLQAFWNSLGVLSVLGETLDFKDLWKSYAIDNDKIDSALSKHSIKINGSNYQNPAKMSKKIESMHYERDFVVEKTINQNPKELSRESNKRQDQAMESTKTNLLAIHNKLTEAQKEFQKVLTDAHTTFLTISERIINQINGNIDFIEKSTISDKSTEISVENINPHKEITLNVNEKLEVVRDIDYMKILLDVISDKTGYPIDMLDQGMDLESDLGIDSLKRTEVISVLNQRLANEGISVELETKNIRDLKSIQALTEYLKKLNQAESSFINQNEEKPSQDFESLIQRKAVQMEKTQSLGVAFPGLFNASGIFIIKDNRNIGEILARKLAKFNINIFLVDKAPDSASSVICLKGLNSVENIEHAIALNKEIFVEVRNISEKMKSGKGSLILAKNNNINDISGIRALANVAANEWEGSTVKVIGMDANNLSANKLADLLYGEIISGGPEVDVAYDNEGVRYSAQIGNIENDIEEKNSLLDGDVVIVSGGAYGITAHCLLKLAERTKLKIIIFGRTVISNEEDLAIKSILNEQALKDFFVATYKSEGIKVSPVELNKKISDILKVRIIKSNLAKLKSLGCQVEYYSVDVRDTLKVREIVVKVRNTFGRIDGIIYGSGAIADNYIHKQTDESFNRVFDTKVHGFNNLLESTKNDSLKLICVFSSIAANLGSIGQVNYAMANEILNHIAQSEYLHRNKSCVIKSIGWGPWDSGMVDEKLKVHFKKQNIGLISIGSGAEAFVKEISCNDEQVNIILSCPFSLNKELPAFHEWIFLINAETCPIINDHVMNGVAVIPAALVLHWALGLAKFLCPAAQGYLINDFKVLKGVKIDIHNHDGVLLKIVTNLSYSDDSKFIEFVVKSDNEILNYSLKIEIKDTLNIINDFENDFPKEFKNEWSFNIEDIYDNVKLLVGPTFQVIKGLAGISEYGCMAYMARNDHILGYKDDSFIDYIFIDGGIQLSLLWRYHFYHQNAMPSAIGRLYLPKVSSINYPIKCRLMLLEKNDMYHKVNLIFEDDDKKIIAFLEDLETYVVTINHPQDEKIKSDLIYE